MLKLLLSVLASLLLCTGCPQDITAAADWSSMYGRPVPRMTKQGVRFKPIGVFHSPYTPATGAPRQGVLRPQSRAEIEIYAPYRAALKDVDKFEYIWVLFYFDQVKGWRPEVRPPKSGHVFGLFATRSPKRPNPIALSLVKVESIDKGRIEISGVDAFEGTPVLDLKPYLPSVDVVDSPKNRQTEKDLGHHNQVFLRDRSMFN